MLQMLESCMTAIKHIFTCMYINFADLNECNTNSHNCDVNANCVNTGGSYSCTCKAGYTGDGQSCNGKSRNTQTQNNLVTTTTTTTTTTQATARPLLPPPPIPLLVSSTVEVAHL